MRESLRENERDTQREKDKKRERERDEYELQVKFPKSCCPLNTRILCKILVRSSLYLTYVSL